MRPTISRLMARELSFLVASGIVGAFITIWCHAIWFLIYFDLMTIRELYRTWVLSSFLWYGKTVVDRL